MGRLETSPGAEAGNQVLQSPDAVELTVDAAWFLADALDAGTFPWVLAITVPFTDEGHRSAFNIRQRQELSRIGVLDSAGAVHPAVARWIRTICRPDKWLDLRYVDAGSSTPALMRGLIARRDRPDETLTVVALRNAHLLTLTVIDADEPSVLVPSVVAGLRRRHPAKFPEFTLPTDIGAKADEQLRSGAALGEVLGFLGVPAAAHPVVESAFYGPRTYVEVVAGQRTQEGEQTTSVGVSVMDTTTGRVLIAPHRAGDGTWLSTFAPGSEFAIAVAVDQLTGLLPAGRWFPDNRLTKDFT